VLVSPLFVRCPYYRVYSKTRFNLTNKYMIDSIYTYAYKKMCQTNLLLLVVLCKRCFPVDHNN